MRILGTARARAAVLLAVAAGALTATPAHAAGATFSGTITDNATGEPIAGACVLLYKDEGDIAYEQWPEVCTEADGTWTRADVEPGVYGVQATSYGYVTQFAYGSRSFWDGQRFTVGEDDTVTVDLALQRAGEVTGVVTDEATGEPIPGICVDVNGANWGEYGCTGDDGAYSVFAEPGSEYVVRFGDWDDGAYLDEYAYDTRDWEAAERFTVVAGETLVVNGALARAATISGAITSAATGAPVPNVCVFALTAPDTIDGVDGWACADELGNYRMTGVRPGTFYVGTDDESGAHVRTWHPGAIDPAASTRVTVASGDDLTGVDIALAEAAYLSGTVTSAATGEPLENVCVSGVLADGSWSRNGGPASCSDAEGRYTVGGLPTGDVKVFFNPVSNQDLLSQWAYGQDTQDAATPVAVVAGQTTTGVDAAIRAGGVISGRVVNAKTKQPVEGVCTTVGAYSHRSGENGTQWPSACTGADGRYELRGLPTGSYTVEFYDPEGALAWQFFPNKADRVQAARLEVTAGTTLSGINAKMSAGGVITGVVTDQSTGEPAHSICVDAYTARGRDPMGTSACTGLDGRYELRGFPTGKVKIVTFGGPSGEQWAHGQDSYETATPIATTAGGATTVNLSITP